MTFKEKLIVLRKNKGLTRDDFAKAVGVSRQAVYKWENGTSYPEVPKLLEIKALYGISLDDLFDDSFEVAVPEKKKRKRAVASKTPAEAVVDEVKPVEPVAEPVVEAPVAEEPVVVNEEPKSEPIVEPAPVAEEPAVDVVEDQADAGQDKKVGFFGRLFGRK